MDNNKNLGLLQDITQNEIQECMKSTFGIEVFVNELSPAELKKHGYRKLSVLEKGYIEPLFRVAPQLIVDRINEDAIKQAFNAATENTFKCILDPSMHLATIKGSPDVFLGTGLDNVTDKIKGQARWLENDAVLSISNAPNIALNAFNALSAVTGQYFIAQVNSKLSVILNEIDKIKQYLDAVQQSELEAALQELYEIVEHIQFIREDPERTRATIIQIDGVRKVARRNINLNSNQIKITINNAAKSDPEDVITKNIDELRQYMIRYRYVVYVHNLAQILKVYLNDITNIEELRIFRHDISSTIDQHIELHKATISWVDKYLEETKALNKVSRTQLFTMAVSGLAAGYLGRSVSTGGQVALQMNDVFNNNRKKKKEALLVRNDEYQAQMKDMEFIYSSVAAMDKYIDDSTGRKAEVVSIEGEYYIKYITT